VAPTGWLGTILELVCAFRDRLEADDAVVVLATITFVAATRQAAPEAV